MGTLALANMVPKMEPDSQWMAALLSQALTPFIFFLFITLSTNNLRFIWFQSNRFWVSENWLAKHVVSGRKLSDRLTTMSAFLSGRHQHGQLLQGRWVKVLMEVVTPQTGGGEGSERHIIRGNALHCEGHVEGQLHRHLSHSEQNRKYQPVPSLKPRQVSFRWIRIFSLCHTCICVQPRNTTFTFWAKIECPGSFPPTMPCTSGVRFTEEVLGRAPGGLRGEKGGGETSWWRQGVQRDDTGVRRCTERHPDTWQHGRTWVDRTQLSPVGTVCRLRRLQL